MTEPDFTVGIEEEYLLVDRDTRDLPEAAPQAVHEKCAQALGERVTEEFLSAQIEVGTSVCQTIDDARAQLANMRGTISDIAQQQGLGLVAAATHPFADWKRQSSTAKDRYDVLSQEMQAVARRLLTCGMHVHVGIGDDDLRITIMNQLRYFLPHILALSTSSPFWQGRNTGLHSYRLTVFDSMPRSGMPPEFSGWSHYRHEVDMLKRTKVLSDETKIWWDIRPHPKFPTIEIRICDVCTSLDDALAIASLCACVTRMLFRLHRRNIGWRRYSQFLLSENRWRAQRYGIADSLIDFGKGELVAFPDLIEEVIDLTQKDAAALGCEADIRHLRTILETGTSAQRQLDVYRHAIDSGCDENQALRDVVDELIRETSACASQPAKQTA
ncbi:MAG: carboxylate-amine ligase [Ahrensia sp.]|nr:carboxylate-amine ligase [Ahrensia sp.]